MQADIKEYIEGFEPPVQAYLLEMRRIILDTIPECTEKIAWGAPAYYLNGYLLQIAANKKHLGFYTSPGTLEEFREDLAVYKETAGSVDSQNDSIQEEREAYNFGWEKERDYSTILANAPRSAFGGHCAPCSVKYHREDEGSGGAVWIRHNCPPQGWQLCLLCFSCISFIYFISCRFVFAKAKPPFCT